jgi:uncharacterized protein (DUF2252 family)
MAYQDDKAVSESQRQVDKQTTNTAVGHKAADIAHYQRLLTAAHKWGVKNGAYQALINLGKTRKRWAGRFRWRLRQFTQALFEYPSAVFLPKVNPLAIFQAQPLPLALVEENIAS